VVSGRAAANKLTGITTSPKCRCPVQTTDLICDFLSGLRREKTTEICAEPPLYWMILLWEGCNLLASLVANDAKKFSRSGHSVCNELQTLIQH
jgi:hypothetical protein